MYKHALMLYIYKLIDDFEKENSKFVDCYTWRILLYIDIC